MKKPNQFNFCGNVKRREFLSTVGGGFPALALSGMLGSEGFFNQANGATIGGLRNPLEAKPPVVGERPRASSSSFATADRAISTPSIISLACMAWTGKRSM